MSSIRDIAKTAKEDSAAEIEKVKREFDAKDNIEAIGAGMGSTLGGLLSGGKEGTAYEVGGKIGKYIARPFGRLLGRKLFENFRK